mgnify:CR=1 FL=1|tara:strand:+ start:970 stop:1461 length:492 start_codon:yes stop_codon:yes gene_type:complete
MNPETDIFAIDHQVDYHQHLSGYKDDTMTTNNNMISLLQAQRGMTTVKVMIGIEPKPYTYKAPPHLDLQRDDTVVVPFGKDNHRKVGQVVEVDDFADLELDSGICYKWVIDVVDTQKYEELLAEENYIRDQLRRAEAAEKLARLAQNSGINFDQIKTPALEKK